MSKTKNIKVIIPSSKDALDTSELKTFLIKDATIKDDFCNYGYEIISGIGIGDTHNVKGSGIIDESMRTAFAVFNVHLATIDDVFKHSNVEIKDIDKMHSHELTALFHVTGFKIKGGQDNENIVLVGTKYVSEAGGRINLETPKIPLDNLSSYQWYNELKSASDKARQEVELYKGGRCTPVEQPEETEDPKQGKMSFEKTGDLKMNDLNADFEKAKVK